MNTCLHHPMLLLTVGLLFGTAAAGEEPSTPGALQTLDDHGAPVELPLRHTDVHIEIASFVARTTVEQVFDNPFDHPIEVTYTFPLGDEAAVDDFEMVCGTRIIRGEIHRREEARQIYEQARDEGYQAALLEQERPNIFTQTISNLMPGDQVRIRIRTIELLEFDEGIYRYVFPLVVGPRYDPGGGPGGAGPTPVTQPPRLREGERSGHDVAIHVAIDAGVPLDDIVSPTQTIYVSRSNPTRAVVELAEASRIPNRDFILRWNVASEDPALGTLVHRSGEDGFFSILVQPKGSIEAPEAAPRDVIMVLDTSGSMDGLPITMSRRFVKDALRSLGVRDRFNLVRFANGSSLFSSHLLPSDPREIRRAAKWIDGLRGAGVTEMLRGLRKVLEIEGEPGRFRQIIFLTDGYIGNERQIIEAVDRLPDGYRIFTIGIGSSVNHYLLKRMAEVGGGASTFIADDGDRWHALERFEKWVTRPYLTDLEFDWGGLPIHDLVPDRPMDLFSGQNLYLIGRYDRAAEGTITARGYLGGAYWEQELPVVLPDRAASHPALASVWARHRIKALLLPTSGLPEAEVRRRVTEIALSHRLMSPFTSFVAVDHSYQANPTDQWKRFTQPVPLPAGVAEEEVEEVAAHSAPLAGLASGQTVVERVRVAARTDVVDVEGSSATTRFTDEFVQDLPVPGRFYQNVLTLAPGVQDPSGVGRPNVHGARSRDFQVEVGGVSNVDPLVGHLLSSVALNSIEEIDLITAGAGVEFSRAQGGFARIFQKQGNNEIEGVLEVGYGRFLPDGFSGRSISAFDGYRAGLLVSGPFIRDRLWFRISHDWTQHDDLVQTTTSLQAVPTTTSVHSDRLTWQVSPRNKLSFEIAREDLSMDNVGVNSWVGPDSSGSIDSGGPRYALTWTAPQSPKVLVETVLAYRDRTYETGAHRPDATNTCLRDAVDGLSGAHCLDLIGHRVSGPAYLRREHDHRRFSLQVDATIYGGRWIGAGHQLKFGAVVDDETFTRRMERRSTLIRMVHEIEGREILVVREAARPRDESQAGAMYWGLYGEDQIKPASNLTVTVGLRVDRTELAGQAFTIADTGLAPFLGVNWDPWAQGRAKLWLTARRYHGRLHPGIATIESEPVTFDREVSGAVGPPNVQIVNRGLSTPYQNEFAVGFEYQAFTETKLGLQLIDRRYRNQLGYVDLNQTGTTAHHDPAWGDVLLVRNGESMHYRALVLEWIRRQYRNWEMQASYTYSVFEGTAASFDPLAGDERNRVEVRQGYQEDDQRHRITIRATTTRVHGFRIGGAFHWASGLPFSNLESRLDYRGDAVPLPRLFYPTGRRNDQRNVSIWTVDAKISREIKTGRRLLVQLSLEILNLFDDETYLVYNQALGSGARIDGVDEATRRSGRRVGFGVKLNF